MNESRFNDFQSMVVLIDADNTQLAKLEGMLHEISAYGRIIVKKAYGNWKKQILAKWEDEIKRLAIKAEQQFDYVSGKNTTDIAMVIDAMDLLHTGRYDAVVLVSSDSDFTPLAVRLREDGIYVIGVGEKKTPEAFRNACDDFIYLEYIQSSEPKKKEKSVKKGTKGRKGADEGQKEESAKEEKDDDIACVIMEPVLGNVGVVPPKDGYLWDVRKITREHDVVLIFDEVITGFRVSSGGAQKRYGVTPDMTTMAKIIGGGFPAGAFMGRRDIMENVAPQGPVYVAGTFAGNPVSAAAGLAQIDVMCSDGNYATLDRRSDRLVNSIRDTMADAGVRGCVNSVGSMFCIFYGIDEVTNATQATQTDRAMGDRLFRYMLEHGVYVPPSALEDDFLSIAHTDEDVAQLEEAFKGFFSEVKG